MNRTQSLGEEIANAISHGAGLLLAVASMPILVWHAAKRGSAADIIAASLFAGTMILLYLVSAIYHALPRGRAKQWFNRLDHAAIYVFIAGSYMPYLLGVLYGAWGWTLFGVVWGVATAGVVAKLLDRLRRPFWSTGLYVAMGWVALLAARPLIDGLPVDVIAWLVAGGVTYTLGAIVYLFDERVRYMHFAWHMFVVAGSACHVVAVLLLPD